MENHPFHSHSLESIVRIVGSLEQKSCSGEGARGRAKPRIIAPKHVCSSAMEKSPRATNSNSVSLISRDNIMSEPHLTQYGLMAERHWREFRPKMVRELEAEGRLMEALFEEESALS